MLCKSAEILDEKTEVKISKKYFLKISITFLTSAAFFKKKLDLLLKEFFVIVEKCK